MAAILRDSVVIVVRTRPRPLGCAALKGMVFHRYKQGIDFGHFGTRLEMGLFLEGASFPSLSIRP